MLDEDEKLDPSEKGNEVFQHQPPRLDLPLVAIHSGGRHHNEVFVGGRMARITVDLVALTDPRFDLLGKFLESNRHEALGRMLLIWNHCQEKHSYTLPFRLVSAIMEHDDGAEWVVKSDLAEWVDDETLRIKGTEGRIEWLKKARENGKKGGEYGYRGGRPKTPDGVIEKPRVGLDTKPPLTLTPTLTPVQKEKIPPLVPLKRGTSYSEDFETFWKKYPRKVGKGNAWKAWIKAGVPGDKLLTACREALAWQVTSEDWTKDAGQFIPHPTTYLNQRRWEDEHFDPKAAKHEASLNHDEILRAKLREMEERDGGL